MTGKVLQLKMFAARRRSNGGFSLLELMIAMFIIIILLSVAIPTYQRTVQNAREVVLKENLWQMRKMIDQYAADKGKLPQSLDELVSARYLAEIPVDPITETTEWESIMGEDAMNPDGGQGLINIKSTSDGRDSQDKPYKDY